MIALPPAREGIDARRIFFWYASCFHLQFELDLLAGVLLRKQSVDCRIVDSYERLSVVSVQNDLPILFILIAVIILLAAIAAAGAWLRGGGLKRDEAESLFGEARDRHQQDLSRLQQSLDESRAAHAESLAKSQEDLNVRIRELESVVASAAREQGDCLTTEMESVTKLISESERRTQDHMDNLARTLETIQTQVSRASEQMAKTLEDLARQQREQKAQSTIQLCEALISSLGTLKNSISSQMTQGAALEVDSELVTPSGQTPQIAGAGQVHGDDSDIDTHHDEEPIAVPDNAIDDVPPIIPATPEENPHVHDEAPAVPFADGDQERDT